MTTYTFALRFNFDISAPPPHPGPHLCSSSFSRQPGLTQEMYRIPVKVSSQSWTSIIIIISWIFACKHSLDFNRNFQCWVCDVGCGSRGQNIQPFFCFSFIVYCALSGWGEDGTYSMVCPCVLCSRVVKNIWCPAIQQSSSPAVRVCVLAGCCHRMRIMKVLVRHAVACWSFQSDLERGLYSYHSSTPQDQEI